MKKLTIILALLIGTASLSAQNTNFGIKAGLNLANITGDDASRDNLISFHAGFTSEIGFSDQFAIQPELLYSRQGSKVEGFRLTQKLDYLSIPLLLKYYIVDGFSIEGGPQVSFLINDEVKFDDPNNTTFDTNANAFDLSFGAGLGYKLSENLFTQARYNFGLNYVDENPDVRNGVFQLSLGYKF